MNIFRRIKIGCAALFGKRKLDGEMEVEMRSHIEMRTRANLSDGTDMNLTGTGATERVSVQRTPQPGLFVAEIGEGTKHPARCTALGQFQALTQGFLMLF